MSAITEGTLTERVEGILGGAVDAETAGRLRTLAAWVERGAQDTGWSEMPLSDLCRHIIHQHHDYLRETLPRIASLVGPAGGHADDGRLSEVFAGFRMDLEGHMAKEENTFFPQMSRFDRAKASEGFFPTVAGPIGFLEAEHEEAFASLAVLRDLTDGFTPPEGAGPSVRALLAELALIDEDMRWHVHKENAVLFPRALALERAGTAEVW
jgi:regulator of cell morphogenesis and NO signaling